MPSNFLNADTSFPWLNGEKSYDQKLHDIQDYLYLLLEQLRYLLGNLSPENLNESEMAQWVGNTVTNTLSQPDIISSVLSNPITLDSITPEFLTSVFSQPDVVNHVVHPLLYAAGGDVADLMVNSLSTSRRIPLYLARDISDDLYVEIRGRAIRLMRGVTDGTTQQATTPAGSPLYWSQDISGAVLGPEGWPWLDGRRVYTTILPTDWPVIVYRYTQTPRRQTVFGTDADFTPLDVFGDGYGDPADENRGKGFLWKNGSSFNLWLRNSWKCCL